MHIVALPDGHSFAMYHSALELPARRHLEYQCRLVQDSGIGSDMDAVYAHLAKAGRLVAAGKQTEAGDELANLHYNLNFLLERFSPRHLSFACLITQIDGQPVPWDPTEEGLQRVIEQLSELGLTEGILQAEFEDVKKKLAEERRSLFPGEGDGQQLAYAQQLKRQALALCDYVLTGEQRWLSVLEQVEQWMLELMPPDIFDDGHEGNVLVRMRQSFAALCALLAEHGQQRAEDMSVYDFQSRVSWLRDKLARSQARA
jgi:hypothetical protein